jgi:small subunit ribosomal protein S21
MSRIQIHENESLERALKRFKKKLQREGVLRDYRSRKFYEKPSDKKRRKSKEAQKKKVVGKKR